MPMPRFVEESEGPERPSEDRISFDSIARLVKPSLPPADYVDAPPVPSLAAPPSPLVASAPPRSNGTRALRAMRALTGVLALGLGIAIAALVSRDEAPRALPAPEPVVLGVAMEGQPEAEPVAAPEPQPSAVVTRAATEPAVVERADGEPADGERADGERAEVEPAAGERGVVDPAAGGRGDLQPRRESEAASARAETRTGAAQPGAETRTEEASPAAEAAASGAAATPATDAPEAAAEPAPREEAPPTEVVDTLPATLTREQVQDGLGSALSAVRACAEGANGRVEVQVTIAGSGRVRSAIVSGAFAGTPQGSCMALAVRNLRFPRFTEDSISVRYPYAL